MRSKKALLSCTQDGSSDQPDVHPSWGRLQEARQALQAEAVAGMSPYCSRLSGMLDDSHAPEPQVVSCAARG